MGSNGAFLAAAAVWLLFCCVAFVGRASAFYSVPADPRHHPTPSPGPAAARRGHYYHGPAPSPRHQHHHRGISAPAPATLPHSALAPAPAPTAGDDDLPPRSLLPPPFIPVYSGAPEPPQQATTTTPHFGFPLEPTVGVAAARPAGAPGNGGGGEGYPFIGSNPTVPLPTGVTDTATVLPLPDKGGGADGKVVGRAAADPVRARAAMIGLLVVFSTVLLSSWSWSC